MQKKVFLLLRCARTDFAIWLEAIASRSEAIASRSEAIAIELVMFFFR